MARTVIGWVGLCFALASPARAQFVRGDLYVGAWPDKIYRVQPDTWNVTLFADASDGLNGVSAITFAPSATLLCSDFHPSSVVQFDSSGNGTTLYDRSTGLSGPYGENGLAYDANGNLFVSDFSKQEIHLFPAGGGTPSVFADAKDGIVFPDGLAFAANGDLFVANRGAKELLEIDSTGKAVVFDVLPADPYSIVIRGNGDIYVACGLTPSIYRYPAGAVAQRTLFASFPGNAGNPALQFSLDESTLYFTSYSTGNLVTIDPDTANSSVVIPAHGLPNASSIGVFGRGQVNASWSNYGTGTPGTFGVPSFTAEQNPVLGTTLTLDLANSYANPTFGLLIIGFQRADIPSSFGGDLLVVPTLAMMINFSSGSDTFVGELPADGSFAGLAFDLQVLEADPGAVKGVSFTPGLELLLGH